MASVCDLLNLYRTQYGLPPAISPHNSFYLWGTHGYDGSHMIAVGATDYALLKTYFRNVQQVTVVDVPYRHVLEGPLPIYSVSGPVMPLAAIWPHLRNYGP